MKSLKKAIISFLKGFALRAHWRATASVAAEDMVPTAVRYAGP